MRALLRTLLFAAALVLTLGMQVSVLPVLSLPYAEPDLVLLAVLALAGAWGPNLGAVVGFAAGLAVDLAPPSLTAAGRHALVLTLAGALAGRTAVQARRSALRTSLLAGAVAGVATLGNAALGSLIGSGGTVTSPGLLPGAAACALYTAVATPLVLPWLGVLGGVATLGNAVLGSLIGSGGTVTSPGLLPGAAACALYTAVATPLVLPWLAALARRTEVRRTLVLAPLGNAIGEVSAVRTAGL